MSLPTVFCMFLSFVIYETNKASTSASRKITTTTSYFRNMYPLRVLLLGLPMLLVGNVTAMPVNMAGLPIAPEHFPVSPEAEKIWTDMQDLIVESQKYPVLCDPPWMKICHPEASLSVT